MKALLTGGGGFLGSAIVRRLRDRGDAVRSFCRKSYPQLDALGVEQVQGDLADPAAVAAAAAGCDIVLHVAARAGVWGSWDEYHQANVIGTEKVIAACRTNGIRRLVFTSSTAGEKSERSGSAYSASKHGLIGLARAVAQDAGPFGVTSNAVLPGWVRTSMAERSAKTESERRGISTEQVWRERAALYPQNRVLEPREVAQVIAFLCSDVASGVNGEAVTVALGGIW